MCYTSVSSSPRQKLPKKKITLTALHHHTSHIVHHRDVNDHSNRLGRERKNSVVNVTACYHTSREKEDCEKFRRVIRNCVVQSESVLIRSIGVDFIYTSAYFVFCVLCFVFLCACINDCVGTLPRQLQLKIEKRKKNIQMPNKRFKVKYRGEL